MSHEIRTPMNGVIGMTALLLDTDLTDEQREYVEAARNSGEALLTIINDILDFSKIESGKLDLERHPFELHNCIEESLDLLAPKAAEKKINLAYFVSDSIPRVLVGDIVRLRQILVNLVGNAVKFTSWGEVVVEVSSSSHHRRSSAEFSKESDTELIRHPDEWMLHFSVRDTGIGIPVEKQHRLFKSFQQVDASTARHFGGTGLGLAISKRLAELMGGSIWVQSQAGKGATFHFTILVRAAAAVSPAAWQEPQPQLAGKRLLVIEENLTNARIFLERASYWGMNATLSSDRQEALRLIHERPAFDVAILDLQLADTDSLALADELRELPNGTNLPLLLFSYKRLHADGKHPAGKLIYVHKPIQPAQLLYSLCCALNIQLQREKKSPAPPALDANFAKRLPLKLLLADDNLINLKVGLSVLRKLGYDADTAANGREVLKAIEQKHYDIVLLDVQMPEMDGLETARHICSNFPASKRPRLIAMTGNALLGDREKCLASGMDHYISKPISLCELQAALLQWGNRHAPCPASKILTHATHDSKHETHDLLDHSIITDLRQMPADDGVSMLNELIDLYVHGAPQHIAQIHQAMSEPKKMAFHAHALKSMSLNMGASRIVSICQQLEEMGHHGNIEGSGKLLKDLEHTFKHTESALGQLRQS